MHKNGFTWNEAQLIRPVEPLVTPTKLLTKPSTAVSPAKCTNAPNFTKPSEANLPLTL